MKAPRKALPGLWTDCMAKVSQTLLQPTGERFSAALDTAADPVQAQIERDPGRRRMETALSRARRPAAPRP